jgi:hypothetical protein
MSLPESWINRLFDQLAVTYGAAWAKTWEGVDPHQVKGHWARELGGYTANPDALAYALEYLPPDKPPTVLQFRAICQRAPSPRVPQLPAPKADPQRVAQLLSQIPKAQERDPKAWAWALKARDEAGEPLTITQRRMYRVVTDRATREEPDSDADRQRTQSLKEAAAAKVAAYQAAHA